MSFEPGVGRAQAARAVAARGARVADRLQIAGLRVVDLPQGVTVPDAIAAFGEDPRVRMAAPDLYVYPAADERVAEQWALDNTGQLHPVSNPPPEQTRGIEGADVNARAAWRITEGDESGRASVIAVLDSGVWLEHPDIAPNLWRNPDEFGGVPNADDDGNGYVDDINGWDFAENDHTLWEEDRVSGRSHGTHVAGVAAAARGGTSGVLAGVCPRCRVMVLKFMRPRNVDGRPGVDAMVGTTSAELKALAYARRMGADVVNASFGGALWSAPERAAFVRLGRAGVLAVVAAGNENGDNDMYLTLQLDGDRAIDSLSPAYPASYDVETILSVAATNDRDRYGVDTGCMRGSGAPAWTCAFTNWGRESVDVAAPGVDILGPVIGGYATFDGTSMAAPHVAGIAGLVKDRHPRWGPVRIKRAIVGSVQRPRGLRRLRPFPGRPFTGGGFTRTSGRVDARRALGHSGRLARRSTDGNISGARVLRRTRRGRVSWPRDVNDVFKKRLRRGVRYKVSINARRGRNLDLVVYRPRTKEIWQVEAGCYFGGACKVIAFRDGRSGDEVARFRARRSRVYFFHVSAFFTTGRYRLRITRL